MPEYRRRFLTDKQQLFHDELDKKRQAWRTEHTAKYGEHTCTPDPNNPWSTCHLEDQQAAS